MLQPKSCMEQLPQTEWSWYVLKRGEAHKRIVRVGVEYGVQPSTRVPKYLDSYNYSNCLMKLV